MGPRTCHVKFCANKKRKTGELPYTYFKCPEDQKEAWLRAIGRLHDPPKNKHLFVCSDHFPAREAISGKSCRGLHILRKGAIPSLFLDSPQTAVIHDHSAYAMKKKKSAVRFDHSSYTKKAKKPAVKGFSSCVTDFAENEPSYAKDDASSMESSSGSFKCPDDQNIQEDWPSEIGRNPQYAILCSPFPLDNLSGTTTDENIILREGALPTLFTNPPQISVTLDPALYPNKDCAVSELSSYVVDEPCHSENDASSTDVSSGLDPLAIEPVCLNGIVKSEF